MNSHNSSHTAEIPFVDTSDQIEFSSGAGDLLSLITTPAALKRLNSAQRLQLAHEVRDYLVAKVSATGGHLGPNLGVVELTIAIHTVFDSPHDPIIWDTGHQSYVHKMFTGRSHLFDTLRQEGGLSGYPSRSESEHDWVESSHASSSLSYADGLARSFRYQNVQPARTVVAVVGDGALTGGMTWEALNNIASQPEAKIIIIVNDNGRSYSQTIGGFAKHLTSLRAQPEYESALRQSKQIVSSVPVIGKYLYALSHGFKAGMKDMLSPQYMFSDLQIKYLGPVDGHDSEALIDVLSNAKKFSGPVIVHAVTKKGKGYAPAESHLEDLMHSTGIIDPQTGAKISSTTEKCTTWTEVFSDELIAQARNRPDIVAITAAMPGPTGLLAFAQHYPDRMIDVGIAEQHALTSAAGMAMGGLHPVVAMYSTFLNRALDQLVMDVALHKLPVTVVLDRSGITGNDGASHNGMWDLSLLSMVPGLKVAAPRDENTLRGQLDTALKISDGPTAIRFPKGNTPVLPEPVSRINNSVDVIMHYDSSQTRGVKVLVVAIGAMNASAYAAVNEYIAGLHGKDSPVQSIMLVDPQWILPINDTIIELCDSHDLIVTIEDSGIRGGYGSVLATTISQLGINTPVRSLALEQKFYDHASRNAILENQNLDSARILSQLTAWISVIAR